MAFSVLRVAPGLGSLRCTAAGARQSTGRVPPSCAHGGVRQRPRRESLRTLQRPSREELAMWRRPAIASPPEVGAEIESYGYFEPSAAEMGTQVVDPAELMSTPKQRSITAAWWILAGAMGLSAISGIQTAQMAITTALAVVAAWVAADAGTGVFHWATDNYGNKQTPVFGNVIDAFQGHHKWPWTITKREFANNVHGICVAVIPAQALILALQPSAPVMAFLTVFALLVPLSQQFHAWSHLRKTEVPAPVRVLQDAGILVSCRAHGAHHRPPFEGNYCIVSGLCNEAMDGSGLFVALDRLVYGLTGVAPRCWGLPAEIPAGATVWFPKQRR